MRSKRQSKTYPLLKGGYATDQALKVGTLYRFVYTEQAGGEEKSVSVVLQEEGDSYYIVGEQRLMLPIHRVIEVNQIIGGI